jgi:hypothetical protein
MAPYRTFLGRCSQEDFESRIDEHLGAHVPTIGDQSRRPPKCPLATQKRVPHCLKARYSRSCSASIFGADSRCDVFPVQDDLLVSSRIAGESHIEVACEFSQGHFVVQRYVFARGIQTNEPVKRPAIQQVPSE